MFGFKKLQLFFRAGSFKWVWLRLSLPSDRFERLSFYEAFVLELEFKKLTFFLLQFGYEQVLIESDLLQFLLNFIFDQNWLVQFTFCPNQLLLQHRNVLFVFADDLVLFRDHFFVLSVCLWCGCLILTHSLDIPEFELLIHRFVLGRSLGHFYTLEAVVTHRSLSIDEVLLGVNVLL